MSNGWAQDEVSLYPGQVVSGVVSNAVISKEFRISSGGAVEGLVVKISPSAVTQVGTITVALQTAIGSDWVTAKTSAAITTATPTYIRLMSTVAGDVAVMPLLGKGRIVITTTNAGDSVTIGVGATNTGGIEVLQEL